jgi:hypothetical protein
MGSVIACGFYTEDYRRWLIPLVASLDRLGQAHDFVLAEKLGRCGNQRHGQGRPHPGGDGPASG